MTQQPLSPAAQAVLDAWCAEYDWWVAVPSSAKRALAAALRAAVATGGLKTPGGGVVLDGNFLLAIAAELEGASAE